jgi:hypothetical protein
MFAIRMPDSQSPWIAWAGWGGVLGTAGMLFGPPKIRGTIKAAWFFCPLSPMDTDTLMDAEVYLYLEATNQRHQAVSVSKWAVEVEVGQARWDVEAECIQPSRAARFPVMVTQGFQTQPDFRLERPLRDLCNEHAPIRHREAVLGWLRFVIPGADDDAIRHHGLLSVTATDVLGKTHKVACHRPGATGARSKY